MNKKTKPKRSGKTTIQSHTPEPDKSSTLTTSRWWKLDQNIMNGVRLLYIGLVGFTALAVVTLYIIYEQKETQHSRSGNFDRFARLQASTYKPFQNAEEFRQYMEEAERHNMYGMADLSFNERDIPMPTSSLEGMGVGSVPFTSSPKFADDGTGVDRSHTNVRTEGIDEADIIKLDEHDIYYNIENGSFLPDFEGPLPRPMPIQMKNGTLLNSDISDPDVTDSTKPVHPPIDEDIIKPGIRIADITDPRDLDQSATLPRSGELLLHGNILLVAGNDVDNNRKYADNYSIVGYDVTSGDQPQLLWRHTLADSQYAHQVYRVDDKVYLFASSYVSAGDDCEIPLFTHADGNQDTDIQCTDIYRHDTRRPSDTHLQTAVVMDIQSGKVLHTKSFLTDSDNPIIYMTANSIYMADPSPTTDQSTLDLLHEATQDTSLFPRKVRKRVETILSYDISTDSKLSEISHTIDAYMATLRDEQRVNMENKMEEFGTEFYRKHIRDYVRTGITALSTDDLSLRATASVPGYLDDEFSIDEYDGTLRMVTTVDGSWWAENVPSENDLYILDANNLKKLSSIQGLGLDERIYSARFVGDRAYMVTFRQTDPFFVFDLSDKESPKVAGELKLPGFSTYLHPLRDHLVLGIGRDSKTRVKASLFDTTDPHNPQEVAKLSIPDAYWSEAMDNHHAFMVNTDKEFFFLPTDATKGTGYIVSYAGNDLKVIKALSDLQSVRRAVYSGDTLFAVSDHALRAYSMDTWEEVDSLMWK